MSEKVRVWEEEIQLPTYGIGAPEKNPMFLEKRVYQGSSGVVYPYPVIEKIKDEIEMRSYHAVWLENEYIKIMVLPELGGRIQMAYDKIKGRHFIYYNHVIKPALVGLTGPWISGGIEFNWPQHHRPSTFLPIDFKTEELPDGGVAVWVSERERMFHQKGMAGFILRPGKAYLEIQGKLYNPTPFPQTFLWWANPAVAVNDFYQSVFPGDVNAVFDHGKRDVSKYPIATGTYYKMDYSAGVDISRYKNIPVPTSYMAIRSEYDFVGGYENDTQAGVLHVANHHISPGKKQWTWGNGDFGRAWDRNLTDTDGPYIELMTGVYTDNQPDFSWLQPYEEKTFTQYFIPYRELGVVKNATSGLLMNLDTDNGKARLKLLATFRQEQLHIRVTRHDSVFFEETVDLCPEKIFNAVVELTDLNHTQVVVTDACGKMVLNWTAPQDTVREIPEPAQPALQPEETTSTEQLFLTGQHLEQYRHATYSPVDYYREGIRRDPSDIRCNNALGLWLIRKGQFAQAEKYLRQAVETQTQRNPNPYDGEPLYNLGMSLKLQGRNSEAYECFYKACWNAAWQDVGYFSLAQLSVAAGNWGEALNEIDKSLIRNWHNHKARHLKTLILRKQNRTADARKLSEESLEIDPFNFGCLFEQYLLSEDEHILSTLNRQMRHESHNYEELALDYADASCWQEAIAVADTAIKHCPEVSQMVYYYKAWFLIQAGHKTEAATSAAAGEKQPQSPFFPNHPDAIPALQAVVLHFPQSPQALYHLGNIWYDKRQYTEAIEAWEKSAALDNHFPTVIRNLALAYFNKLNKKEEAIHLLEKAFRLDTTDARILMELDQLYKRMNYPHEKRLELLDANRATAFSRDDVYLSYVTLLNQLGHYEKAIAMINDHKFHPWEGGEGKVPEQYQLARVQLARRYILQKKYAEALPLLDECYIYPAGLGEGKLPGACENDFDYYKACALEGLGRHTEATALWEKAAQGNIQIAAAMYYNDQKPDKIFYQGLALQKSGREKEAQTRFNQLVSFGEKHLSDIFKMDYFAVSLPDLQIWDDDMDKKNQIHCHYLMGLGYLGLGETGKAISAFGKAAKADNNHQGVQIHREIGKEQNK